MRTAFVDGLISLAEQDPRILFLTADLGFQALERFRERFPQRFFNVGVAEQNMVGMATGLADAGYIPFVYSIASFASLRAFEFIRNGPVMHKLPVRIVGMGMGFEYGHAGPTHYAVEDIGVMRTLPGLTIVIPADSAQTASAIRQTHTVSGPIYYSLGKNDNISVPGLNGEFALGRIQVIRNGNDVAIVSMGSVSQEATAAADLLVARKVGVTVAIVSNFNPDPERDLARLLEKFRHVISVEAHTATGGLGALVGTVIASHGLSCKLRMLAVRQSPDGTSGDQADRWRKHGLDRANIVAKVIEAVRARKR